MILVTVGTHNQGFNRLVEPMDKLAAELDERVVIQYGCSTYKPQNAEYFDFTSGVSMEQLTIEARLVVSHAAAGAIIVSLNKGKPLVLVPRLRRYGEHNDDHQMQLATMLADQGRAITVFEPTKTSLNAAIAAATTSSYKDDDRKRMIRTLRGRLSHWAMAELNKHNSADGG